jgi:hypothetical protein
MQFDEAEKLKKQWEASGNQPCDHPRKEKEHYLGSATGDEICTTCGKSFWRG